MKKPAVQVFYLIALNLAFGIGIELGNLNGFLAVALGVLYFLAFNIIVFEWCEVYSKSRNLRMPGGAKMLTVLFPPLGLAYYFFNVYSFGTATVAYILSLLVLLVVLFAQFVPSLF